MEGFLKSKLLPLAPVFLLTPSPGNFPSIFKLQFPASSSISRAGAPWSGILSTMSLQLRSSARIPSGSISPFMRMAPLAFLLLFTLPQHLAEAAPSSVIAATELRCVCLTVTPKINPKLIANLEVIPAGPQCPVHPLFFLLRRAKLKNQKEVCLDPEAPVIKKIIQKILGSDKKKAKRNALAVERTASVQ